MNSLLWYLTEAKWWNTASGDANTHYDFRGDGFGYSGYGDGDKYGTGDGSTHGIGYMALA